MRKTVVLCSKIKIKSKIITTASLRPGFNYSLRKRVIGCAFTNTNDRTCVTPFNICCSRRACLHLRSETDKSKSREAQQQQHILKLLTQWLNLLSLQIPLQGHRHKNNWQLSLGFLLFSQWPHHGNTYFVSELNRIDTGLKKILLGK